jgi:hypothetical protein
MPRRKELGPRAEQEPTADPDMPALLDASALLELNPLDTLAEALLSDAPRAWESPGKLTGSAEPPYTYVYTRSVSCLFIGSVLPGLLQAHPAMDCEGLCRLLQDLWDPEGKKCGPGGFIYSALLGDAQGCFFWKRERRDSCYRERHDEWGRKADWEQLSRVDKMRYFHESWPT